MRILFAIFVLIPGLYGPPIHAQNSVQPQNPTTQEAASKPMRVKMSSNMMKDMLAHGVAPIYPDEARHARVQGIVKLHAIIGTDGSVRQLEVISGDPLLVEPSLAAVKQWKYKVTALNGEPVEVDTTIDLTFSIKS